ncbi:hypothetical protein H0G86_005554 [Trichoderma simmonsii]|uniref:Uncharacterized protein n=1 Tax=Trichoderma simmonsii TaxID=1491479 RepID=A0A8G0PF93_9HYPO|nr:hypothetical protein H0G86_005554 [Trichoderma simmonsii]
MALNSPAALTQRKCTSQSLPAYEYCRAEIANSNRLDVQSATRYCDLQVAWKSSLARHLRQQLLSAAATKDGIPSQRLILLAAQVTVRVLLYHLARRQNLPVSVGGFLAPSQKQLGAALCNLVHTL